MKAAAGQRASIDPTSNMPGTEPEELYPLDNDCVLQPLDGADELPPGAPIVADVHGRQWRIRARSGWLGAYARTLQAALSRVVSL